MVIDLGVIALFCFAAFAFGSNESWAMGVIACMALGLLAARLVWDAWHQKVRIVRSPVFIPLLIFLAYAGGQALLRHDDLTPVNPWRLHTAEQYTTVLYWLLAGSCVAVVFLVQNGFRSRAGTKALLIGILAFGTFEAIYGLVQYLGDYNYIWHFNKTAYKGLATGTLINRNHYSLLLNMAICTGVGFIYYRSQRLLRGFRLSLRNVVAAPGAAKLGWIVFLVALMGLAVVFSMSRMGIVAMLSSVGVMIAAANAMQPGKRAAVIGLLVLVATISLAIYTGIDPVLARYEHIGYERESDKDRVVLWQDAVKMIGRHPVFGQGLGTFQWTYPAYETLEPDIPARYAHSDYVQALAEVGIVGLFLILWAFGTVWRTAMRNLRYAEDPLVCGIGLATVGALTAVTLQEITDFGLYIPGVAIAFSVLLGLNLRAAELRKSYGIPAER